MCKGVVSLVFRFLCRWKSRRQATDFFFFNSKGEIQDKYRGKLRVLVFDVYTGLTGMYNLAFVCQSIQCVSEDDAVEPFFKRSVDHTLGTDQWHCTAF